MSGKEELSALWRLFYETGRPEAYCRYKAAERAASGGTGAA